MIFPHTVTIYNKTTDGFVRTIVEGVYWFGSIKIVPSGNGVQKAEMINIVFPKRTLNGLNVDYYLRKGDRIVKGAQYLDINSWAELHDFENVITIGSVATHDVGSRLDSVVVTSA